jgi:hypothetical protein
MTGRPANIADYAPIIFLKTVLIELGPFEKGKFEACSAIQLYYNLFAGLPLPRIFFHQQ